ncbi:MAG: hypothetical protein ABL973_02355 [Micropepsaceae bacterium]
MIVNGRDTMTSVESAIAGARDNESRLTQVLSSAAGEAERLRKQLAESFKGLALVRLDVLMRNQVVGELDAAERRALELMRSHKAKLDQILIRCGGAQSVVVSAESDYRDKTAAVQSAKTPIVALQQRVESEMRSDATWAVQQAKVKEAVDTATAADAKATQAEADRDVKRKPYESDPLFLYLWKRKFGSADYHAGNFVRFLDRKVAVLVGYDAARPNYALLNEIPARLREHAQESQALAQQADVTLENIERDALVRAGIVPMEAVLTEAEAALRKSADTLAMAQQAMSALDQEKAALQGDGDRKAHGDALAVLSQAVALESLQTLYQEARQTNMPEDDRLVQQVEKTQNAIAKADAEVAKIRDEAREAARRRGELETVRDQMRTNRFDRSNSQFEVNGPDVIGSILGGIIGGALQSGVLWEVLRNAHRRRDWEDDDDDDDRGERGPWGQRDRPRFRFPSSSMPKFPGGSGGGGFGGGGFRTGGGFKGGGFRTGGKF